MEDRDERHEHESEDTSAPAEQRAASEQTEQRGRGEGEERVGGAAVLDGAGLHVIDEGVFADEINTVLARREAAAKRPDPGAAPPPASGSGSADALRAALEAQRRACGDGPPRPDPRLGLTGLSISGGGIRSATFNLGIIQVFAKRGLLRWFDYLSTVSGGGYVGSALSSTLLFETENEQAGGAAAPFAHSFVHRMGREEPRLIKHLRRGRDYLAPGGVKDLARIPALLLRGIFLNLLVVAPLIGLLAILSAVAPPFGVYFHQFEFTGFSAEQLGRGDVILEDAAVFFMPTIVAALLFVAWSVVFPLLAKLHRRTTWATRNRYELGFSTLLLLIIAVFTINALPCLYYVVFNGTLEGAPPFRIGAAALAAVLPVATSLRTAAARSASFNRLFDRLKLLAAGLLGPLILLSMYLGMAWLVLSPLTVPFGELDSALNVAARALDDELMRPAGSILAEADTTPYARWVEQLWERVSRAPGPPAPTGEQGPFYVFLDTAMRARHADLGTSLGRFKRQFGPAIALRISPLGMRIFGDNRFIAPLRKSLAIDPLTGRSFDAVSADELLAAGATGADGIRGLTHASEELRKDIVLTHSAILLAMMAILVLYAGVLVNINKTGLHRFYRDRLSRAYLFDPADPDGRAGRADALKLSEIDPARSGGPYHLINAALNIPATEIADLQGRRSDFFTMSPRWCGSSATGYTPTRDFEAIWDRDLTLASAFAISGAAASPQMGVKTSKPLALIMTLLNIRLDYWAPNPKVLSRTFRPAARVPGPNYLLREISGQMTVRTPFVNLSDGGHIENLGLYELLRRRCKHIVACDAEQDPDMILSSLGRLTAYARMDNGIWIDWGGSLARLKRNIETGYSAGYWAVGRIHYADRIGRILYIKSSMIGDEWPDMAAYRAQHPAFPQESTGDQFFDEEQFEAYRALGYLIASDLFGREESVPDLDAWFDRLEATVEKQRARLDEQIRDSAAAEPVLDATSESAG